ncbi:MAG: hypothetical protein DSY80_07705 [Desulfocapsa sp.]|nr:MAG: hypothetical protein DSY80_07705 [Desulfocapsa sp.]
MDNTKLLPCPFCGSTNVMLHESKHWFAYSVFCCNCGARVGNEGDYCNEGTTTAREAVMLWNRRDGCNSVNIADNLEDT